MSGSITLVSGPMFSGKTEWLINKMNTLLANECVFIRNVKDNRNYLSKSGAILQDGIETKIESEIPESEMFMALHPNMRYLFVDEGQFFTNISELNYYADSGIEVYVSALMFTSEFDWFQPLINFYPTVDNFVHLKATCNVCGKPVGCFTRFKEQKFQEIAVGSDDQYYVVCRECMCKQDKKGVNDVRFDLLPVF